LAILLNKEEVLRETLECHEEYTLKIKWCLIPGIW
jgi:hypothetical protein